MPCNEDYFAALYSRRSTARPMKHRAVATAEWSPKRNQCHKNVDYCVSLYPHLKAIRGWMIVPEDECGRCWLDAHSVIEDEGELYDITLSGQAECDCKEFLQHVGDPQEFWAVVKHCSQTSYPFPTDEETRSIGELVAEEEEETEFDC